MRRLPGNRIDRRRADGQAAAQNRVSQVGPRLIQPADRLALRLHKAREVERIVHI